MSLLLLFRPQEAVAPVVDPTPLRARHIEHTRARHVEEMRGRHDENTRARAQEDR